MTILTEAFVIKKSARGDFDRQYTLYTKELGKITALAKGALKITSKLAPHLDFFYLTEVMVAPGRTFYRLAGARVKNVYLKNKADQSRLNGAKFFLEAIDALMADGCQDKNIFKILQDFFYNIDSAKDSRETRLIINRSLYDLLSQLGYRPKIKASNQSQLTDLLSRLIRQIGEKELPSSVNLV